MAIIHPFRGWLPKPEKADEVASVPYDVISADEAAEQAEGKPDSFLHVIRPEIDLPEGTAFNDERVYEKGAQNLERLLSSDFYEQDEKHAIYIYQLEAGEHTQTGIFTCASVEDYDNDVILKHELTRPDKEDDRTRHITTQQAHAEPVMLTFRDTEDITFHIDKVTVTSPPFIEHKGDDGVIHRIWKVFSTVDFVAGFSKIQNLYIADGHHRCKAASRAAHELREESSNFPGENEFDYFPVVLFPMDQMRILPYNRIVKNVGSETFEAMKREYKLEKTDLKSPARKGDVCIYYDNQWWLLTLPQSNGDTVVSTLDAARLQDYILKPFFKIENPRTDKNIDFVGGIRGTDELEKRVNSGDFDLAFSMYPTSIQELIDVSDQGELMPPKSTWFEPKLKSGLIIHTF